MASVYKRGPTWWVRFQFEGEHVRRSARTTNKRQAEAFLRNLMAEYAERARNGDKPRHLLRDVVERFFAETTIKPGTRRTYTSNSRNWIAACGHLHLDEIDRKVIASFISERKKSGVTDTTIRRDIAFLGTMISMAIGWGWIDTNPVTAMSKKFLRESPPRTRFLTRTEFKRLHAVAHADLKPIITLAVETGMRKEEMLGLTMDSLDLRRREVHLQETKTNSPRRVPLSDKAIETITDLLAKPNRPTSRYLFCKPDGSRMLCNKKGFKAACERAGIVNFRFHDLRHTFASWWVQGGGDLYKLSRVLGHRTLQMTARYGHLRTDDLHEEIDRIAQKLAQGRQTGRSRTGKAPA
jgi:integrase